MPEFLTKPYPTRPLEVIRSDPRLSVFSRPFAASETSPHYQFLPTELHTNARPFFLSETCGSECSYSLGTLPTLGDVFVQRIEPILDFALALGDVLCPDLQMLGGVPALLTGLPPDDRKNLEDEEMDGSNDLGFQATVPTMEAARALFAADEVEEAPAEQDSGRGQKKDKKPPRSARGKGEAVDHSAEPCRLPVSDMDELKASKLLEESIRAARCKATRSLSEGVFELSSRQDVNLYVPPLVWPFKPESTAEKKGASE